MNYSDFPKIEQIYKWASLFDYIDWFREDLRNYQEIQTSPLMYVSLDQ